MFLRIAVQIFILLFSLETTTEARPHCRSLASPQANQSAALCDVSFTTNPTYSCLDFPKDGAYTIQNNSPVTLTLNYVRLQINDSEPAGDANISANTCGASLAPGATCTVTIHMISPGPFNRVLQFGINSRQAVLNSPVITPTVDCSPASTNVACSLDTTSNFSALANSVISNNGTTELVGDLGLYPGTTINGFPPGSVSGSQHLGDSTALTAQYDLMNLANCLLAQTCTVPTPGDLTGQVLTTPGVYCSDSSIVNNGDLTLGGGATAVYIFIARSSLTMGNGSRVIFSNDGTKASNVFWLVGSSASIGQGAIFKGTIVANNDINFGSGATVSGRALTETGAINLVNNTITLPVNS